MGVGGGMLVFKKCFNLIKWHHFDPHATSFVDDNVEKMVDNLTNMYIVPSTYT